MSETIEAQAPEAPAQETNILSGIEFGSDQQQEDQGSEAGGQGASEVATEESAKAAGETPPDEPGWYVKRIGAITAKRKSAEERAEAAERERDELRRALAAARGEEEQPQELTADQIRQQERDRDTIAKEQAQQRDVQAFSEVTRRVAEAIAKTHGEAAITSATAALIDKAGLDFDNAAHRQIIADISELPNSGDVYYALANNPDAAIDLLGAPERRQFAKLQQFAATVTEKPVAQNPAPQAAPRTPAPQISRAPAPVAAAAGSARPATGGRSLYDDNMSAEDFAKMFNKRG